MTLLVITVLNSIDFTFFFFIVVTDFSVVLIYTLLNGTEIAFWCWCSINKLLACSIVSTITFDCDTTVNTTPNMCHHQLFCRKIYH